MPSPNNNRRPENFVMPPSGFLLVATTTVTIDTDLPALCRGILVGTAGFLNVTMQDGTTADLLPFIEGLTPGFFSKVRTSTGTGAAQNVWAVI